MEILAIISRGEFDGPNFRITDGTLDRKVYQEVAKVVDAAGGKWSRKAKALVFDGDAAEALEPLIMTGEVARTKQEFGQFDTPETLAAEVADFAEIKPGMLGLEPSFGIGNIAAAMEEEGAELFGVEIDKHRCIKGAARCRFSLGIDIGDFLAKRPTPIFHRVAMNPTFARRADIAHVRHAAQFLLPGEGFLVAIMSAGVMFREDRATVDFRKMVTERRGAIDELPEDSFKASGTGVNTCLVSFRG